MTPIVMRGRELSGRVSQQQLGAALATAEEALKALERLRDDTDMDHEAAYHAMFKSDGAEAWGALSIALVMIECVARGEV
jgi:hypothetical protein